MLMSDARLQRRSQHPHPHVGNTHSRLFRVCVFRASIHRRCDDGAAAQQGGVLEITISRRELRNESGAIMRALDRGATFLVTRNGVPVGELRPARRRFVSRDLLLEALATAPPIDAERFRDELDAILDRAPEPRA
jgi:antitoxin (DNA-binding transcriptional repressor) of toxin-antitoxin stability system